MGDQVWRATFCCTVLREDLSTRSFGFFVPGTEDFMIEFDASLEGIGLKVDIRHARNHDVIVGAGALTLDYELEGGFVLPEFVRIYCRFVGHGRPSAFLPENRQTSSPVHFIQRRQYYRPEVGRRKKQLPRGVFVLRGHDFRPYHG